MHADPLRLLRRCVGSVSVCKDSAGDDVWTVPVFSSIDRMRSVAHISSLRVALSA